MTTTRVYNPETSRYEVEDPWAGAPAGIRIQYNAHTKFPVYGVLTAEGSYFRDRRDGWNAGTYPRHRRGGLQEKVTIARATSYEFPDFDGAPEGVRFYHNSGKNWHPNVALPDGRCWSGFVGGYLLGNKTAARWIEWHRRAGFTPVLVDELPEEPKPKVDADGLWKIWQENRTQHLAGMTYSFSENHPVKEEPEFRPGDVIRDLETGVVWYANPTSPGGEKIRSYQQVGVRDLLAPLIVKPSDWQRPERFKVVSRAVAQ